MGTKCAPPYASIAVVSEEETKLFPTELPKFFSTEEIEIMKEVFIRYSNDGLLLWSVMLNFDIYDLFE